MQEIDGMDESSCFYTIREYNVHSSKSKFCLSFLGNNRKEYTLTTLKLNKENDKMQQNLSFELDKFNMNAKHLTSTGLHLNWNWKTKIKKNQQKKSPVKVASKLQAYLSM